MVFVYFMLNKNKFNLVRGAFLSVIMALALPLFALFEAVTSARPELPMAKGVSRENFSPTMLELITPKITVSSLDLAIVGGIFVELLFFAFGSIFITEPLRKKAFKKD